MLDPPNFFSSQLTTQDKMLLDKHLNGYLKLLDGRAPLNTPARKHFKSAASGSALPMTPHEAAFVRWQISVGWREKPKSALMTEASKWSQQAQGIVHRGVAKTVQLSSLAKLPANQALAQAAIWYNALLASDAASQIDRWMREAFDGPATIYDRAMDTAYAADPTGGMYHRYFDGSHDLVGAWHAIASASDADNLHQEVAGYLAALWKDVVTPTGLPIATLDYESFTSFSSSASELLGLPTAWFMDTVSVTATEVIGSTLGVLAVALGWNSQDHTLVSSLAGSLVVSSAVGANPILLIIALVCLARAYQLTRSTEATEGIITAIGRGGTGTAAFIIAASMISGPVWISLVAGVVTCVVASKAYDATGTAIGNVDWSALTSNLVETLRNPRDQFSAAQR